MMTNRETVATASSRLHVDEGLRQYMMKVYNYMSGGLCVTALVAFLLMNNPSIASLFFTLSPAGGIIGLSGLGWLALFAPFLMVFGLNWVISRGTMAQVQATFWSFAAVMGISLTPTIMAYTGASVTRIFLITAAMFGGMSLYGYTTKKSLTTMGSFLIMGVWGLVIAMLINMFVQSSGLYYALSALSVLIFTGLTAYDTQNIRQIYLESDHSDGNSRRAVYGALSLYLDFINIFISLLNLFAERK